MMQCPVPDLGIDSVEYELLWQAALDTASIGGLTCEIGLRLGGATELILRASGTHRPSRPHIAIDPYGNLPYRHGNVVRLNIGTDDAMRRETLRTLYEFADYNALDLLVLPWKDTDFFTMCANGVPWYLQHFPNQTFWTQYSLVHFDGPHTVKDVLTEVHFFASRTVLHGQWVFDDVSDYSHVSEVEPQIFKAGFERIDDTQRPTIRKAVYRRI